MSSMNDVDFSAFQDILNANFNRSRPNAKADFAFNMPIIEEWRKIQGFEGYTGANELEVSDYGRIRRNGQVVAPVINDRGYWVDFTKGGHREWLPRLVLRTFNGPCPEGLFAVCKDRNLRNCRLYNLEWGTHSDKIPKAKKVSAKKKPARTNPARRVFDTWLERQIAKR